MLSLLWPPKLSRWRAALRITYAALRTVPTALLVKRKSTGDRKEDLKQKASVGRKIKRWAKSICRCFGVSVTVHGKISEGPALLLGNHMSYIDILVLFAIDDVSFVAKDEIKDWPFLGAAGEAFGIIYVDRNSPDSRQATLDAMRDGVKKDGRKVVIFPGGTTQRWETPWRHGSFKLAEKEELTVQFFALTYTNADLVTYEVDGMVAHALVMQDRGPVQAEVHFSEPQKITNWEESLKKWEAWNKEIVHASLIAQGQVKPEDR